MNQTKDREFLIFRKNFILGILSLFAILLLRKPLTQIYASTVIDHILKNVESDTLSDLIFSLIALLIIVGCVYRIRKNKKIGINILILNLGLLLLYCYFRFYSNQFYFRPFTFTSELKYSDIVFLVALHFFAIWIADKSKSKGHFKTKTPFLESDLPLTDSSKDILQRRDFAKYLAEKIQESSTSDSRSLAIGINGEWGSGKTSFANMVKENINEKSHLIIDFNPWNSSNPAKITEDYFTDLANALKPFDHKLSISIGQYTKTLIKIDENLATKLVDAANEIIIAADEKSKTYQQINAALGKLPKHVLVFIDDLDRLDKLEIIEVIRLIRNTANFNNLTYIVSYDRQYINTAIKDFNEFNHERFLEKIFQFEFMLPFFDPSVLRDRLMTILKKRLGNHFHAFIEESIELSSSSGVNLTSSILKTNRDILRFSNSLLFEITPVLNEINFTDFYLTQLIKIKFGYVYELLKWDRELFIISYSEDGISQYRLRKKSEEGRSDDDVHFEKVFKKDTEIIDTGDLDDYLLSFLIENKIEHNLTSKDITVIISILKLLLPEKTQIGIFHSGQAMSSEVKQSQQKSFKYPRNYYKYFAFSLLGSDIAEELFTKARERNLEDYKKQINAWLDESKQSALIDKLKKLDYFDNTRMFENHLEAILIVLRRTVDENAYNRLDSSMFFKPLRYPIFNPRNNGLFKTEQEYADLLIKIFERAAYPFLIESQLISTILLTREHNVISPSVLDRCNKRLSDLNLSFFEKHCSTHQAINQTFYELYRNSLVPEPDGSKNYRDEIRKEAKDLFKNHFIKNVSTRGLATFIRHNSPYSKYYSIHMDWVTQHFDTQEEFETFLEITPRLKADKEYYGEFVNFYQENKKINFRDMEFKFEFLRVNIEDAG